LTLEVAIPDTTLQSATGLREKTTLVGQMARALAIFRVERVIVYETGLLRPEDSQDTEVLVRLLRFMDTPQYLRRRVFPRSPSLRYAGLLPPLRTRSHPLESDPSKLRPGDIRWGIGVGHGKVDVGLRELVDVDVPVNSHEPTLFRVDAVHPRILLRPVRREEVQFYFGFEVVRVSDLVQWLRKFPDAVRVAMSRRGAPFSSVIEGILGSAVSCRHLIAVFGGPRHGIAEIFSRRSTGIQSVVDYWVNTIPSQGTETVRLEEAIIASLALLNNTLGRIVALPGYYDIH